MTIAFTPKELLALQAVLSVAERVNWADYDAAKRRILAARAKGKK